MEGKKLVRLLCITVAVFVMLSAMAGCGAGTGNKGAESTAASTVAEKTGGEADNLPMLEYSVYGASSADPAFISEENDAITPVVEKKFKVRVKEFFYSQGMSLEERMNLFIASDTLPDVVFAIGDSVTVPKTGRYAELGPMIKQYCPNAMRLVPEEEWKDSLYNGRKYGFPSAVIDRGNPKYAEELKNDPYIGTSGTWAGIWVRESILKKCGYSFTPLADIVKKAKETGVYPDISEFKTEPSISTPDEFYTFLKKIKELNLQVDGKPVIPFNMPYWLEGHFGAGWGLNCSWFYDPQTKHVRGFLTGDHSKEYWQYMNKLYKEGLLDKDFSIQKDEQIQEKAVQGRLASAIFLPDVNQANTAIQKLDPTDQLRQITFPKLPDATLVGIDHISANTFQYFINKDFKDIPRLLKYFDWTLSDEAFELDQWGPESLGLWEMKDGKKVWKDDVYKHIIGASQEDQDWVKQNIRGRGLWSTSGVGSKALTANCAPRYLGPNKYEWVRSYPISLPGMENFNAYTATVTEGWNDYKNMVSSGIDEISQTAANYTNPFGEFQQQFAPKLFAAKTDAEFEKNWNDIMTYLNDKEKYKEGKKKMEMEYKIRGFDVSEEQ